MTDSDNQSSKSLSQVIDEIETKKLRTIKLILNFRYAEREGIDLGIEPPISYNFEPGFADLIINTLADAYLNLAIPPQKKKPPELIDNGVMDPVLISCFNEIQRIWDAIINVGFSGRNIEATPKGWQEAALRCFDENQEDYEAIKRQFLEETHVL